MKLLFRHQTERGPVYIGQSPDGRFHIMWKDESLGNYATVQLAIGDASQGSHESAPDGVDLGSLDLSDNMADWAIA